MTGPVSADDELRHLMRALPAPYVVMTPDLVVADVTDVYADSVGRTRDEVVGRLLFEVFPPGPGEVDEHGIPFAQRSLERARDTGLPDRMPLTSYGVRDGSTGELVQRWWSLIAFPVLAEGRCVLLGLLAEDVTDLIGERDRNEDLLSRARKTEGDLHRQARMLTEALHTEEEAARRVRRLARVALGLNSADSFAALTDTVSQGLRIFGTDGGAVLVPGAEGGWRQVVTVGPGERLDAVSGQELPYDSPLPAAHVARTGEPLALADREAGLAFDLVMKQVYDTTGLDAWAFQPLRAGDETVGVLSVGWAQSHLPTAGELRLLDAFAAQLAAALQRIRAAEVRQSLAERAQRLSETLQRSLLTTPRKHERLDIAVRYLPAAEEAQVGGDWYDAFVTQAGRTMLVVGDVTGHDRIAAAMMGQVRNLLRGMAFDSDDGPAALLSRLDVALSGLDLDTLATCLLVSVEPDDGVCRIRWSNAGHLPPLLRLPDGSVRPLDGVHDLLLGVDASSERHEGEIGLAVDSVLVLYTDGLVERRDAPLDEGIQRLGSALRSASDVAPEALCDRLLDALDDGGAEDDVALLVARVGSC